jgi:hypothetical protein
MIMQPDPTIGTPKGAPHSGVVKLGQGTGQVAIKFIEPAKYFNEALANTRIMDEDFLRNIVLLQSKMERFNEKKIFDNEITSLTNLLLGMRSINGIGMNLASMTDVDIYYPEGGGMPTMKGKDKQALREINSIKRQRNRHNEDEDED